MDIGSFLRELERVAPPDQAEAMDDGRIGLIIEGKPKIRKVACSVDVTLHVIREAVSHEADMLVTHHTPIWNPVTAIREPLAALVKELLGSGLNVYVMHTNFDHAVGGINDALGELLGLENVNRMSLGVCGDFRSDRNELCRLLAAPALAWGDPRLPGRIAVVGGSGFDLPLIEEAVFWGAEAFLSADLKYAVARASPLPLIETSHSALEAPGMRRLAEEKGWLFIDDPLVLKAWT
jgi:dinuclear metal center YbgI/SA1388 family protein